MGNVFFSLSGRCDGEREKARMGSGTGERLEPEIGPKAAGGGRRREKEGGRDWLVCVAWGEGEGLGRSLG